MPLRRVTAKTWNNPWLAASLAGVLLGLSFPPFPFPAPLLQFIAWPLLFRFLTLKQSRRTFFLAAFSGFLIWNGITTYWLVFATLAGGLAAIIANSAVMAIPLVLMRYFWNRLSGIFRFLAVPSVWIAFEFLHHKWDLAWPWLTLGNAWSTAIPLVQYSSITGVLGISFWVLLGSLALFMGWHRRQKAPLSLSFSSAAGALILLPPLVSAIWFYGFYEIQQPSDSEANTITVGIVQPNFDSHQPLSGFKTEMQPLQVLLSITDSLYSPSQDLIVWPENAIEGYIPSHYGNSLSRAVLDSTRKWQVPIISGATFLKFFNDEKTPPLVRYSINDTPYLYYNSGVLFRPDGSADAYKKNKLVPIVERIPFLDWLHHIPMPWFEWNKIGWYAKGRTPNALSINGISTPTMVCYDSIFSDLIRTMIQKNNQPGFLTIITNDGWWGHTSGHIQHFQYAQLQAIIFRKWIVRSANNGISGIIREDGTVAKKTDYWVRTAFDYTIPLHYEETFFVRYGNLPAWFALLMTGMSFIFIFQRRIAG